MDLVSLVRSSKINSEKVTIEATVATGFEPVAFDECIEKLKITTEICKARGRIFFNIDVCQIHEVLLMRSIDNVFIVVNALDNIDFPATNIEDDITVIQNHAKDIDWLKILTIWKDVVAYNGITYPTREEYSTSLEIEELLKENATSCYNEANIANKKKLGSSLDGLSCKSQLLVGFDGPLWTDDTLDGQEHSSVSSKRVELARAKRKTVITQIYNELDHRTESEKVLKYRVTCNRSGSHTFGSQDAAHHFGGTLQDMFNWVVDLELYDLEIVLNIKANHVYVTIAVTKESLHKRNINHFGPTTLRATVCYNLLRLGEPQLGDIIVDPMTGGGSIPIEGVLTFPGTYHVGGDVHPKAIARSWSNLNDINDSRKVYVDLMTWDAKKLPLKDSSVDLFVSDMPFGKRSGSKKDNRRLYTDVLLELGRVVRPGCGRVVLLTQDRRSFTLALSRMQGVWKNIKILGVNIGGLDAAVYVLKRAPESSVSF